MLKFRSLADGDCLYNSEAVSLIQAFLQGKLNKLFKNRTHLAEFHRLLKIFEEHEWGEVADEVTEKSVRNGFNALITAFTDNNQIQWVSLQQHLSIGLREFVTQSIITDQATKNLVKTELHRTINQCIDMAYVDGVLVDNIEIEGINGSHFDGMEVIENKIAEVLMDDTLLTADQKKRALREWFFAGEETGLNEYLQGENGIGNVAVFAGEVEIKVLSRKLGIIHKTCPRGAEKNEKAATYYNGFSSAEQSRKVPKGALVFSFEKTPNHWNCLLPATAPNRKMVQLYNAQLSKEEAGNILEEILVQHDSFAAHHAEELSDLSVKEYCKLYGITQKQYDNPEMVKQTIIAESAPKADKPSVSSILPYVQISDDLQLSNFTKYFLLTAATIGVFSHCILMPFLIPALSSMLLNSASMASLQILSLAMTTALSSLGGYFIAEKLAADKPKVTQLNNNTKPKTDTVEKAEKTESADKQTANKNDEKLDPPKPVLVKYQTRSQTKRSTAETTSEVTDKPVRTPRAKAAG